MSVNIVDNVECWSLMMLDCDSPSSCCNVALQRCNLFARLNSFMLFHKDEHFSVVLSHE